MLVWTMCFRLLWTDIVRSIRSTVFFPTPPKGTTQFEWKYARCRLCIYARCTRVYSLPHESHCIHSEKHSLLHFYRFSLLLFCLWSVSTKWLPQVSSVRHKYGIIISHMRVWSRKVYAVRMKCYTKMTAQKERKIKSTQKPSLRSAAFFLVLFFYSMLVFHRPPITLNEPCENHGNPKKKHTHKTLLIHRM